MKLLVAVVHNNEETIPAHSVASKLRELQIDFHQIDVSNQTLDTSVNLQSLISHSLNQYQVERLWREYRQRKSVLKDMLSVINRMLYVLKITLSRNSLSKEIRIRQIEIALTSKHMAAWNAFHTSNFDFLLVMEADATWNENQRDSLSRVLGTLSSETADYLNIAGGLPMGSLQVDRLILMREINDGQEFLTFSKPVTNTTCAYIINRPLVDLLLGAVSEPPIQDGGQLGADWFINDLFIQICGRGHKIRSQHFIPPLLMHGSMSGISVSWHPDRK